MGLCKCPKRKVTNLFCFVHRVNVCEHCIVSDHSRCVVRSYLQWLQDSDFKPDCALCHTTLSSGEVLRLVCYDVFHVNCLDEYASDLPANTAPAGYTCPVCKSGIFPAENHVSPVVDEIRRVLARSRWAQAGLGRPIVDDSKLSTGVDIPDHPGVDDPSLAPSSSAASLDAAAAQLDQAIARATHDQQGAGYEVVTHTDQTQADTRHHSSAGGVSDPTSRTKATVGTATTGFADSQYTQRKGVDSRKPETKLQMEDDHDEDKYRRRSPFNFLVRWLGLRTRGKHRSPLESSNFALRRATVMIFLFVIGVLTFIVLFTRVSSNRADSKFLDPFANPNIHIKD